MCVLCVYHSERGTALKQTTDEVKETLEDIERAQTAASEKLKEVKSDMNQTKEQITAVSICIFKNLYVPFKHYQFFLILLILFNEIFLCLQVQSKTEVTEFKLSSSTGRFLDLEREVDELQQKTQETSRSADQTQKQTDNITEEIEHTAQVTNCLLTVYLFKNTFKGNLHI